MSLFLPTHRKTYFETKILKKKIKKKRKKKGKKLTKLVKQPTLVEKEILEETLPEIHTVESPVIEPIVAKSFIQQRHPDASTYYDNIQMFNVSETSRTSFSMVGKKAKLGYLDNYRSINQCRYSSEPNSHKNSPMLKYLQKIDEKKLSPMPMGMIKRKGNITDVEIGMYSMGDSYAEALSEGMNLLSPVKLQLNDNRLTDQGISKILTNLSYNNLIELNLSNNKINQDNLYQLDMILTSKSCILQVLKLEGLNLKDIGCKIVCRSLKKNRSLIELSLAKNHIEGNKTLSSFISQTYSLQKLDLH